MKAIIIFFILPALLLAVQLANGYALNKTHFYTPEFSYLLIAGLVVAGWIAIFIYWLGK